jgi:hypothetical protein
VAATCPRRVRGTAYIGHTAAMPPPDAALDAQPLAGAAAAPATRNERRTARLLNLAHAIDHMFLPRWARSRPNSASAAGRT